MMPGSELLPSGVGSDWAPEGKTAGSVDDTRTSGVGRDGAAETMTPGGTDDDRRSGVGRD